MTADTDPDSAFSVEVRPGDGGLALHGELDVASAPTLVAATELLGNRPGDLRLDLGDLQFCGSVGLSCLVKLHNQRLAHGGRLVLVGTPKNVMRVLVTTGLDSVFAYED